MARRDRGQSENPDDWFGEPESSSHGLESEEPEPGVDELSLDRGSIPPDDDWTVDGPLVSGRSSGRSATAALARVRLFLAGGALVVVLVIALAAAGVFSGSSPKSPTGRTSPETLQTTRTAPTTQSTPTPTLSRGPKTTLAPGDSGHQVRLLQQALTRLGYSPGVADGSYGLKTKDAVSRFQQAEGLTADGVFGAKTLRALTQRLGSP